MSRLNPAAWFIQRPIATSLFMAGILFLGLSSYLQVPIAGVPQVDIPTISITTSLPGANAETIASSVTSPLERALSTLPGVSEMTSTSSYGSSSIQVQFDLSRSVDGAAVDVQQAINAAGSDLPKTLPHPPVFEKANPADALLMTIAVYSDTLPISQVDAYVENYLAPQIARVTGVGVVDYHGQQRPAVRVDIDPGQVAGLGLTLEDVRQRIATATVNGPKGTLSGTHQAVTLDASDQLSEAAGYAELILTQQRGASVRLKDVATVADSVEDVKQSAWLGSHQAVMIDVHKQPGYNLNETVTRVRQFLPSLERELPASVHLVPLQDRTQTIRASVRDVTLTLLTSCALVVLVVYAFLGTATATLIPAVAIPLSLFGTVAFLYVLGYTLDNVSLMALTVSVGFVVDDAIVMLENIARHVEEGAEPRTAALRGSAEIGFTILAMTISLIAVFIPLLFMGGIVGRVFHEFAYTAAIAILLSGVVSLTLTPVLCAQLLGRGKARASRFARWSQAHFDRMAEAYAKGLRWVLAHQRVVFAIMLGTLAAATLLYVIVPKGFFPQQDNGLIVGVTEASADISYPAMLRDMQQLAALVREDDEIQNVYYWIEGDPSLNIGRMSVDLKPFGQRHSTVYEVLNRIQQRVARVPDITIHLQARQDLNIGARVTKTQFAYTLSDANLEELQDWAPKVLAALRTLPEIRDVEGDLQTTAPRVRIALNRDAMARLGVTVQSLDDTLYDAFGQRQVANYYTQVAVYRVILEVDPRFQLDEDALKLLYVPSTTGQPVPLGSFSTLERTPAPLTVSHDGLFPAVTLSFNLANGFALGQATDAITAKERSLSLPAGLTTTFTGSARAFQDSLASQPFLILAALVAIFIVLGALYESYIHPVTIMSTLPSAGIGGLLALMLLHYDFSLIALIGIILLIGIVKKNGIMMVDVAIAEEAAGLTPEEAIYRACVLRFRPIMMTTLAALLGALPLAFGTGAGSELRRPLGIVMVGGLLLSQILTLYTTPVVYLYMDRLVQRMSGRKPVIAALPVLFCLTVLLGGCAVGPNYHRPTTAPVDSFKEARDWKEAEPADTLERGPWWTLFDDPTLNQLESRIELANQNLRLAEAQYRQAHALAQESASTLWPVVAAAVGVTRSQQGNINLVGNNPPTPIPPSGQGLETQHTLQATASWEPDLWGGLRRALESGRAAEAASAADLASMRLSIQAELASDYFQLRTADETRELLEASTKAFERSLNITRAQYDAGVVSRSDVILAETQLKQTQAQAIDLAVGRAQLEHAIALLIGEAPAALSIAPEASPAKLPGIPVGLPSGLLERRPDVAAAERRVAAANAQIGVATAAFFPVLTLSAEAGYQGNTAAHWISSPNLFWSVGPALAQTLFDAGARRARLAQARASYDATVATYRETVLGSFRDVEDAVAALRVLEEESAVQDDVVSLAQKEVAVSLQQYKAGTVTYLNVVTAQATALANERAAVSIRGRRLLAAVALVRSLGGGWTRPSPSRLSTMRCPLMG
jgi:hydrophobe/amphiphile efflux-1 (HAE1) family protein/NodT family efflux transporter outer membrane factor (OMF) lipoprotein